MKTIYLAAAVAFGYAVTVSNATPPPRGKDKPSVKQKASSKKENQIQWHLHKNFARGVSIPGKDGSR